MADVRNSTVTLGPGNNDSSWVVDDRGKLFGTLDTANQFTIQYLDGKSHVKLKGRCGTLVVQHINGASVLDLNELICEGINIQCDIDGKSVVTLRSSSGVSITGRIDGESKVYIDAKGVTVDGRIDGKSVVDLFCQTAKLNDRIDGKSTVSVTCPWSEDNRHGIIGPKLSGESVVRKTHVHGQFGAFHKFDEIVYGGRVESSDAPPFVQYLDASPPG